MSKDHTRTVEPRKNLEKIRLHEFIVFIVGGNSFRGIKVHKNNGLKPEQNVTTTFLTTNENNQVDTELPTDTLEECVNEIFRQRFNRRHRNSNCNCK